MARVQKSLEERLAVVRARQAQLAAQAQKLSVQQKQKENRLRGQGEKTLLRVLLQHMRADAPFRKEIASLVDAASLRPDEQNAVSWVMLTLAANEA